MATLSARAQAPVGNIGTSSTSGCTPLIVTFNDNSSNIPTGHAWTFAGGTPPTSTNSSQTVIFNAPGTHLVTLVSSNASGSSAPVTVTITVYPSPTANFSANATTGCFPKNILFTDASDPGPGATLTSWTYDFGDGNIESGTQSPSHTYHFGGNFPVTEFVKNNYGCQGSASIKTISGYITLANGVLPYFTDSLSASCKPPVKAYFNNQTTGPATLGYTWNFGDGVTSTAANPTHDYTASGTYTVKMVATSTQGCGDTSYVTVNVAASTNTSSFSVPSIVCAGTPINITNTSNPSPNASAWSYSDGSKNDTSINAVHSFPAPGAFSITLHNDFSGCSDSSSQTIQAVAPPTPAFIASDSVACKPSLTVNFTDKSISATSWTWDFGDGSPMSNLPNPSHTYTALGQYSVTLTVSSASGCNSSITKTNYIKIVTPVIIINAPTYGCAPYSYTPTYKVVSPDPFVSYHWDYGNGFTYDGASPPARIYAAGLYTIKVTATSKGGCVATYSGTVKIGTTKPVTAFIATPTSACTNSPVQFTDQSTGGANQWLWDFGDGKTDTTQNPIHSYTTPGVYAVKLTAFNNGCYMLLTKTNYVTINPPLAGFTASYNCSTKNNYTFTDTSQGATSWVWDFGDGTSYTGQNPPVHTYPPTAKSYTVKQTVSTTTCSNTVSLNIDVLQPTTVTANNNPSCKNTLILVNSTFPSTITGFTFDFGDGYAVGSGGGQSSHTYTTPGDYVIKLYTVDKNGCSDSSAPYIMHVSGPVADFSAPVTQACQSLNASFKDLSATNGGAVKTWAWDFGDGQTSTAQNPTHLYKIQGIYAVKLKVTDVNGCVDSVTKSNFITLSVPTINFSSSDTMSCPGKPVKFTNSSTLGYSTTYAWDFGNGNTSTAANPPLQFYAATGQYTVSLSLTDKYGCSLNLTKVNYVNIDNPVASFTLSATSSSCPPLLETFTFTGHYAKSVSYNFYDGGSSDTMNTVHLYGQPGDYYPTLAVTSPGGCVAYSPSQHIHIDGPLGAFTYGPLAGCDSFLVNLNVATANVTRFVWYYGDNTAKPDTTTTPTIAHEYNQPGAFVPFVTLIDATGCNLTKIGTDSIYVDHIISPSFTVDDSVLCDDGNVQFTDNSKLSDGTVITNYQWNFGNGVTLSGMYPAPTGFYSTTGQYLVTLTISTTHGCMATTTKLIKVVASPQVDISGAISSCLPATETFQGVILVADTSAFTWAWDFKNGATGTGQNPPAQLYTKAGFYAIHVVATNSSGCTDEADAPLYIYPIPDLSAGIDTTICLGQTLQLNATGAANYTWQPPTSSSLSDPNINNPVASPIVNTAYIVKGFSTYGCQAFDTILVKVNQPVTVTVSNADSVCIGQSVQLTASGAALYAWTPTAGLNNPSIANPIATPSVTTNYQVVGSDDHYCFSDTKTINITVFNYPVIELGPDVTIPIGTSYQVPGTGSADITNLTWTPTTGLSCTDCVAPLITPIKTTTYRLEAVNVGGCASNDSVRITVVCNGSNFFIPNTFSPNGDGHNDRFYVQGVGLNVIPSITIFNRWGQIVFQKTSFAPNVPSDGWDGKIDGKPAPADVYVYTIDILCDNATLIPYHGNVTLIR